MSTPSNTQVTRNKCGCGKTQDPQGYCDGSHAKPAQDTRKKCGCGKSKDPQGYCDGSHAK